MSRKAAFPQHPRHVLIRDDDWDFLTQQFDRTGGVNPIGVSVAIRVIIHSYVQKLRTRAESARELKDE